MTTNAENVDAFEILNGTTIAVSTTGNPDVPGITGEADEDLLQCSGSFGPDTVCTWSYYFDGSDVGVGVNPSAAGENVDGAAILGGDLSLSTSGGFSVPNSVSPNPLTGADEDVFQCIGGTRGATTSCASFSLFFDGSVRGVADDLDAIDRP